MKRTAALVVWVVACSPAAAPAPPPGPTATAMAPEAEVEPPPSSVPADLVVADALAAVARHRELEPKGPVGGETISRVAMVKRLREQIRREIPERVVRAQNELLFSWGLAPRTFDFEEALLTLMKSQLAGFYDPRIKRMYLLEDLAGQERDATLAHELVHALQDQYWDLESLVKFEEGAGDRIAAVHAVAEGDATSAMMDGLLAPRGMKAIDVNDGLFAAEAAGSMELAQDLGDVPGIVKRSVISPYVDGLAFVHWARRRGGWSEVNAVWARLPASTEQILHPEKYLAGEVGEVVPRPPPPAGGPTERIYHDVLGEQTVRLVFEEWMPTRTAVTSAAGWGGDHIVVYSNGGRTAVAWRVRYDDEAAAKRGFLAFARGVLRPSKAGFTTVEDATAKSAGGKVCVERAQGGAFSAQRSGRDVALVAGPFASKGEGAPVVTKCTASLTWASQVLATR